MYEISPFYEGCKLFIYHFLRIIMNYVDSRSLFSLDSVSFYAHKILLLSTQLSLKWQQLRSFVPLHSWVWLGATSLCLAHHFDCLLVRPMHLFQLLLLWYLIFLKLEHCLCCKLVNVTLRQSWSRQLCKKELISIKQPIIDKRSTYIANILLFLANSFILSSFIFLSTSFFSSSCCFCNSSILSSSFLELFLPLIQLI